ncbi:Scr1 family TA system antitoxin-like transcriptional regulator [Lentzea sp. JNUCC 0626]|uniref:Scr1 family TA system antitoxin-like transcriptional regulator n=1 Tax=Lentzea sp. JNUCC 0626 TaxID=3367513 RepID=UPI003749591F
MAVGSTRGKRRLGRFVGAIADREKLNQTEIADRVQPSRQTVMRLLSGEGLPKWATVLEIMWAIGASREEIQEAQRLHGIADVDTKIIPFADDFSDEYLRLRMDEAEAELERTLNQSLIPGQLQTAAFAQAVALKSARRLKPGWAERAGAERESRQALLSREPRPLELHALIDEAALRKMIGGPEVMAEQLDHLLKESQRTNVTIQVLPDALGAYGAHSSPLTLLSFADPDEPDCAYLDGLQGLTIFEGNQRKGKGSKKVEPSAADVLSAVWRDVAADALKPNDSVAFISDILDRVRG